MSSANPTNITTETLPSTPVTYGRLRYVSAGHTPVPSPKPYGLPFLSEFQDERIMPLYNLRPLLTLDHVSSTMESTAQLTSRGFTAIQYPSAMHSAPYTDASWRDSDFLKEIYVPEIQEMMKRLTGAQTVIVETLLLRNSSKSLQEPVAASFATGHSQDKSRSNGATSQPTPPAAGPKPGGTMKFGFPQLVGFAPHIGALPPAPKVHLDYAPAGARTHIRLSHPSVTAACASIIDTEDRLLAAGQPLVDHYSSSSPPAPRWAIYSVWRPLRPVKRDPLAVGDVRTFKEEDYVVIDSPVPTMDLEGGVKGMHTMKSFVGRGREGHRWCYVSEQKPEEVLVIRFWDSDREGDTAAGGGAMHSSVELEGREEEEPRESLEVRCLAIW